jgi:hypothetical protein
MIESELVLANKLADQKSDNQLIVKAIETVLRGPENELHIYTGTRQVNINRQSFKMPEGMEDDISFCLKFLQERARQRAEDQGKQFAAIGNPNKEGNDCYGAKTKTPYPHA